MKSMTSLCRWLLAVSMLAATCAYADPIPFMSALTTSDLTQYGRLSRNGEPQNFAGDEQYPGVINPTTRYYFHAYSVFVGNLPFLTVSIDTTSANIFFSGYQTAYVPSNKQTNWLGDAGASNFFNGTDAAYYQVRAALNSTVVILVNQTGAGLTGVGDMFTLYAQGCVDATCDNPIDLAISAVGQVIPEPATIALLAVPLAALGLSSRRRRRIA